MGADPLVVDAGAGGSMASRVVSILYVDDNFEAGAALERWFRRLSDFRWLGWVSSTAEVEAAVAWRKPDVLIMDLSMPGEDPLAVVARLKRDYPALRIVMLSAFVNPRQVQRALDAGAIGYMTKTQNVAEIAAEVRLVAEGRSVFSPEAAAALREIRTQAPGRDAHS